MSAPTVFASVVTNPGGTGSTITPTLSTHAAGDVLEIFIGKTGNVPWTAPAGWTTKQQLITSGSAAASTVGTLIFRRVLPGDTLPLASPVCNLGATVTRGAICQTRRGTDVEGVHVLSEWQAFGTGTGNSNPISPSSITTPAPEMEVSHYYCQRAATNAPEPTDYTQTQQIVISGTLVINVATRTISDQQTTLSNQDASPTSGARWVAMISAAPSPDYSYYRSGSQAFNANATNITPALPTGTTASDNRGNKDLIILTAQCAGAAPTVNTPGDWTLIDEWSNTTSGGVTTVRKWRTNYTGTLDRQVNRTPSGEIFAYLSVYHNAHQSIPVGTSAVQQNASSTTSTFPALPRTGTKATVQATCVADATPTFTAPSGWTERNDSQGVTCADQSFNATGTIASASFTLSAASPTLCGLMEIFSVASSINLTLTPATAALTLTTFAPAIDIDITVTPPAASLTLTTSAPAIIIPADFPFTGLLDNFDRANGSLGANWGGKLFDGDDLLAIDTNQVKGANAGLNNSQGWATQFGPDVEAFIEIVSGSANQVLLAARWTALGTAAPDGYAVRARGATDNVVLFRFDDGVFTVLLVIPQVVDDGDWLGFRVVGDTLKVYYLDISVSPNWIQIGEETDATYSAAGFTGLLVEGDSGRVDNFSGGTIGDVVVEPSTVVVGLTTFAPQLGVAVTVQSASFALTTFAPTISINVVLTPASASLSLATFAAVLQLSVTPAAASLATSTFAPQIQESLTPTSVTLNLTTFAPSVTVAVTVTPETAVLGLTTFAPTVVANVTVTPASRALELTTFAPMLVVAITPASATLALTTSTPQLQEVATVDAVTLSLTAFAPEITVSADITVTPTTTNLTLTTFAPDVVAGGDVTLTPDTALLTLTGFAPSLSEVVTPATAMLTLTTFAPALVELITPAPASLVLSTSAPSLREVVTVGAASLTLTAFAPTVTTTAAGATVVTPAAVTLTLTGYAPWLFLGFVPARRTFVVESGKYEVEVGAGDYEFVDEYEDDEVLVS